jgi:two-component system response regulator AtoC
MSTATILPSNATDRLPPDEVIFGQGSSMDAVHHKLDKVASTNIPVLIEGESGTGKEVIAKYLHQRSGWSGGPFVKINCPAIPGTLMESELFGYEQGAFTGATGSKPGRVETAEAGTLFLDEVSELPLSLQSKLLQLLQDGRFCPLGGQQDRQIDVRVICATNHSLQKEVDAGRFRQDLFYRINVVTITLPPLRERIVDLEMLVNHFLQQHSVRYRLPVQPLSLAAVSLLKSHQWPGNIRELENLTKRFMVFGGEEAITDELCGCNIMPDLQPQVPKGGRICLKEITRQVVKDLEIKIILNVLQANNWNRKRAARALDISYRALLYKLKDSGLSLPNGEEDATLPLPWARDGSTPA